MKVVGLFRFLIRVIVLLQILIFARHLSAGEESRERPKQDHDSKVEKSISKTESVSVEITSRKKNEQLIDLPKPCQSEKALDDLHDGAEGNATNKDGETALMWAPSTPGIEVAKGLVDAGAKLNAHDIRGKTPLMCAAEKGRKDIVELLLSHGAFVNDIDQN